MALAATEAIHNHCMKIFSAIISFFLCLTSCMSQIYVDVAAVGANNGMTWADAYVKLDDAIQAANVGDEIWVAAGIYVPSVVSVAPLFFNDPRSYTFHISKDIKIYGGFIGNETAIGQRDFNANVTVLSGEIGSPTSIFDNSYHVVFIEQVTNAMVLDGFTISGGNANSSGLAFCGGGVINIGQGGLTSHPIIINNIIESNRGSFGGGFCNLCTDETPANPILRYNTIRDNSAANLGGGMYYSYIADVNPYNVAIELTGNIIDGNTCIGSGGGGYITVGNAITLDMAIDSCLFIRNTTTTSGSGAGLSIITSREVVLTSTVTNSDFAENNATQNGGGLYFILDNLVNFQLDIANCGFYSNVSIDGAGIYIEPRTNTINDVEIHDCTFYNNTADEYGGGIAFFTQRCTFNPQVYDCGFFGNDAGSCGGGISDISTFNAVNGGTYTNNVFSGNSAFRGGGMNLESQTATNNPTVINNTFCGNTVATQGGGIFNFAQGSPSTSLPNIINSIFWGNTSSMNYLFSSPTISYTLIEGGVPSGVTDGGNNMDVDPRFTFPLGTDGMVGTLDDDCSLSKCSPALDVGLNSANPLPQDIIEESRVINSIIDLGAYEFNLPNPEPVGFVR